MKRLSFEYLKQLLGFSKSSPIFPVADEAVPAPKKSKKMKPKARKKKP